MGIAQKMGEKAVSFPSPYTTLCHNNRATRTSSFLSPSISIIPLLPRRRAGRRGGWGICVPLNFNPKVSRISGLQCERGGGWNMSPSPPPFSRDHLETISSVSCAAPAWRAEPRKSQSRPLQQLHPFPEKRRRRRRVGLDWAAVHLT